MSIRLRLTLIQAAILGIVLTAFAVVVYMVVARELDQRLDYTVYLSGLEAKRAIDGAADRVADASDQACGVRAVAVRIGDSVQPSPQRVAARRQHGELDRVLECREEPARNARQHDRFVVADRD